MHFNLPLFRIIPQKSALFDKRLSILEFIKNSFWQTMANCTNMETAISVLTKETICKFRPFVNLNTNYYKRKLLNTVLYYN